jgi:hypothetical protein
VLAAYLALGVIAVISIAALYSWVLVVPIFAVAGYLKNIRIFSVGYWLWPTGGVGAGGLAPAAATG